MSAITDFGGAFSSDRVAPVVGHLLLAVLSLVAGVVALFRPDITALALAIRVGGRALVTGVVEITTAFAGQRIAGERALWAAT